MRNRIILTLASAILVVIGLGLVPKISLTDAGYDTCNSNARYISNAGDISTAPTIPNIRDISNTSNARYISNARYTSTTRDISTTRDTPTIPTTSSLPTNIEAIKKYEVDIDIRDDGFIDIEETIRYNFGSEKRHGIYRDIPYIFRMDTPEGTKSFEMDVFIYSVKDLNGNDYQYVESSLDDHIRLKIGDPDVTIAGEFIYIINYSVGGAIRYLEDHDELYWNAIGAGWDVPIENVKVSVNYPVGVNTDENDYPTKCYSGTSDSVEENCVISKQEEDLAIYSIGSLNSYEGISVVLGFPKGLVDELRATEIVNFFDTALGKIVKIVLIIIGFMWYVGFPIIIIVMWYKYGRDPDVGIPPTAHFDPPSSKKGRKLTPAETGALIDEKVQTREIISTIVDLARRGHLKIVEKKKNDFYLERDTRAVGVKLKDMPDFELMLLNNIFETSEKIRLKDTNLYSTFKKIEDSLYDSMVSSGFFLRKPNSVRNSYYLIGTLAFFTMNFPLGILAMLFGKHMPRKTLFGAREANKARGLRSFLKSQERQLEFQADAQMMFEKLLPFAIAFGVEKVWLKRFESIKLKQPDWYQSKGAFTQAGMMSGLNKSFTSINSSVSSPRSSSSGFSGGSVGGGGGGGGGGSW